MTPLPALLLVLTGLAPHQGEALRAPASGHRSGLPGPATRELAGQPLAAYPHFRVARTFNEGESVHVALDPLSEPRLAKKWVDVYVLRHEDLAAALAGQKLASVLGAPLTRKLTAGGIQENTFLLDRGSLPAKGWPDAQGTIQLGRGYDVVVDVNQNAALDEGDLLDGGPDEAGFHVVEDFVTFRRPETRETGPYPVSEVLFDGGTTYTREDIYFPSDIALLGELPLIVVSHGNGHNYQWYDHLGYHMASWGYVVMSHANNTGPGPETAALSTLRNTNLILARTEEIADGALVGHIDARRIVWIGHSRGGEGVVHAYKLLERGNKLATLYGLEDIRLVSSIAPTDFLGPGEADMGIAPYHLWTGGADSDVNGCADCNICQTFHLLERADGTRYSTSLHGAGHGDFHSGSGGAFAQGPCRIGRQTTHQIMRATLLPLVQHALDRNPACLDFLTRQWEEFRALGAPDPALSENACVVVDLMYMPGPERERFVLDDFQSLPELDASSSGGAVLASPGLIARAEGRLDDANGSFTVSALDVMNGMTLAGPGDVSAGTVIEWNATDEWLAFEVPVGARDLRGLRTLSFRAAQCTRDEITVSELGDLDLSVQLTDGNRRSRTIRIGTYGGGIEEPYQRGGCGTGNGWANEFETIRIPLVDFTRDGAALDLGNVLAVTFLFGPSHGSPAGRIGLDEIVFTAD